RDSLEKLRDLVTDLQLIDGVRGLVSLFSARQPPEKGRLPAALFPEELPQGAEYDALIERVRSNEIIRGRLLSEDGELALVVLALDPGIVGGNELRTLIGEIRKTIAEDLAGSDLRGELSGVPVMQLEIRNAVERDRLVYNTVGFVAGCTIAILFLRRVSFMIIAAAPPLLGVLLLRNEAKFVAKVRASDFGLDLLRSFCAWIAARMVSRPGLYSLISLSIVGALGYVYANLEPRYRLADQVPDKQQAVAASSRIDAKLTGANPVDVLIEFPKGKSLYDPATLATIAAVHAIVEKQAGVGNVLSLETLRRWLAERAGKSDVATLKQYVDILPAHLVRRFIAAEQDAVVVSGRVPDVDASRLLPVVDALDRALDKVRAEHPGYSIAVTGLSAIAARNSANMIGKLNRGLTVEIAFVAAFIRLAFRSPVTMLVSILPGVFPILVSGTLLWATGQGLQFASIVALTVSFGLGLSATIHFLNRLLPEDH